MKESPGGRLREERERLGLSQRRLAELGGVSKNTQLAYENGASPLSIDYVLELAKYGIDAAYVSTGVHSSGGPANQGRDERLPAQLAGRERQFAADEGQLIAMQVVLPSEAALARMFEGLLRPLDRGLPVAELAQTLARRLPTGLAQLQGLRSEPLPAARLADDEDPQVHARADHESRPGPRT